MLANLPPGSLIVADLGYFGFRWFDDLTDGRSGVRGVVRNRIAQEGLDVADDRR
jgi:hypothetical protein